MHCPWLNKLSFIAIQMELTVYKAKSYFKPKMSSDGYEFPGFSLASEAMRTWSSLARSGLPVCNLRWSITSFF